MAHGPFYCLGRVWPRAFVMRIVVGPHDVVDDTDLLREQEADVVLLERREAMTPEVLRREIGDHGADPEVMGPVRVVHGLEQPRHEADPALDDAGGDAGV